jgi:hypothetical protein
MPDLANEDIDRFHVYGVDLGHNHLFTAAAQQHTKLRFSNKEWYTKAGFKRRRYAEEQPKKNKKILPTLNHKSHPGKRVSPITLPIVASTNLIIFLN